MPRSGYVEDYLASRGMLELGDGMCRALAPRSALRPSLEQLKRRVQKMTDIAFSKAQSALVIIVELERLLDMPE